MSFSVGIANGSIAGDTDVLLSSISNAQVLAYDTTASKWKNVTAPGLPSGGTASQLLAKNSSTDADTVWLDATALSNGSPLIAGTPATPGTSTTASRSDHSHPISLAFGYATASAKYSSPVGGRSTGATTAYADSIMMSPLVAYVAMSIDTVAVYSNGSGNTAQLAIYRADNTTLLPAARAAVSNVLNISGSGIKLFGLSGSVNLVPGMYWIGILPISVQAGLMSPLSNRQTNRYLYDNGYDTGNRVYSYNNGGSGYTVLPTSLSGVEPMINNDGTYWYQVRST